jgi:hypothetical protein
MAAPMPLVGPVSNTVGEVMSVSVIEDTVADVRN